MFQRQKKALRRWAVNAHPAVKSEYEAYISQAGPEGGKGLASKLYLIRLNAKYRLLGRPWSPPEPPAGKPAAPEKKEAVPAPGDALQAAPALAAAPPAKETPRTAPAPAAPPAAPTPAAPAKKVKFPYRGAGSESESLKRKPPLDLAAELMAYDVVSFDVFDTLILRPFATPQHLFYVLERKTGIKDFYTIRREAERQAREAMQYQMGTHEVTLDDIYAVVERLTGLDGGEGARIEYEAELEFCFANPYMQTVYKALLAKGKRIIAVSDMYLPEDRMRGLLERCGYGGISAVYVSCDYKCSKRNRGLFHVVQREEGREACLAHVGDNRETDIENAKSFGFDTVYYRNVHEAGAPYRPDNMSEITAGTYAGIVNTEIHNGLGRFTPHFEHGFIYGGLYVMGFCHFIRQRAREQGIDKVLFLSRDGLIYQRVFHKLCDDVPSEYVFWSRIISLRITAGVNRYDFIKRFVHHKAGSVLPTTAHAVLSLLSLESLEPRLAEYAIDPQDMVSKDNEKRFESFFCDHWDDVVRICLEGSEHVLAQWRKSIGDARRVAVVDVGWTGTGSDAIRYMVKNILGLDTQVYTFLAASGGVVPSAPLGSIMQGELEPYIFSRCHNRELYDEHFSSNRGTDCIYFELFTQAQHPSFFGIDPAGAYQFDLPEVENYRMIQEMHEGIEYFCDCFLRHFSRYPHLFAISGYDAYLPFRLVIRSPFYIRKLFSSFTFARGLGADMENQRIETVGEIMDRLKL